MLGVFYCAATGFVTGRSVVSRFLPNFRNTRIVSEKQENLTYCVALVLGAVEGNASLV